MSSHSLCARSHGRRRYASVIVSVLALSVPLTSRAAGTPRSWLNSNSGFWSIAGNWSPTGVPGAGDLVTISVSGTSNTIVSYDYTGPTVGLGYLILDNTRSSIFAPQAILSMTANSFSANTFYVGYTGRATVNQSGGLVTPPLDNGGLNGALELGYYFGSSGTYNLSGTGTVVLDRLTIGDGGTGVFNLMGGTLTNNNADFIQTSYVAENPGTTGTFNISGGQYNLDSAIYVGYDGNGTVNQTGGSVELQTNTFTFTIGGNSMENNSTGVGTYNMTAGTITTHAGDTGDTIVVGNGGVGVFNQSGPAAINAPQIFVGYGFGGHGEYHLFDTDGSGSVPTITTGYLGVGEDGVPGVFTQVGGSINTGLFRVGDLSSGIFSMDMGAVSAPLLSDSGDETIGNYSNGTFNQSAGLHTITGKLTLGNMTASSGTYALSLTGALTAANGETLGDHGHATFTQTGGSNSTPSGKNLTLGNSAEGSAFYSLGGTGVLTVGGNEIVGNLGGGIFLQTGGTHIVAGDLILGGGSPGTSTGAFALSSGTLIVTGSDEYIGLSSSGLFTQTGGAHTISGAGELSIASPVGGSSGTYNLDAGTLTIPSLNVYTSGHFNYNGGTLLVSILNIHAGNASFNNNGATLVHSLTFGGATNGWTGQLDLHASSMIVEAGSAADKTAKITRFANQILEGKNGGAWNGQGITSSTVATNNSGGNPHNTIVALVDNAELGATTFRGQSVDANSIILTQAVLGDTDLSGSVDFGDLLRVAQNFGQPGEWAAGNMDGPDNGGTSATVDFGDLLLVAQHFGQSLSLLPDSNLGPQSSSFSASPVPEPASLALLACGAAGMWMRRRRSA